MDVYSRVGLMCSCNDFGVPCVVWLVVQLPSVVISVVFRVGVYPSASCYMLLFLGIGLKRLIFGIGC